jgi:hypothetical protein
MDLTASCPLWRIGICGRRSIWQKLRKDSCCSANYYTPEAGGVILCFPRSGLYDKIPIGMERQRNLANGCKEVSYENGKEYFDRIPFEFVFLGV